MNEHNIDVNLHKILVDYAEVLYQQKAFEQVASLASELAYLESKEYIGYLSSNRLEILLKKVGSQLFPNANYKKKTTDQRRVLHIGTEFYNVGGHTKVALDWMRNDGNSDSELLLIHQQQAVDLVTDVPVYHLEGDTILTRVAALRQFLEKNYYDIIVLHQHMEDVVPTLALWDAKTQSNSLLLLYNHANFRFFLGNIIAHKRLNICEGDVVISEKYRYPMDDQVLYFIVGETMPELVEKETIKTYKKELAIEEGKTVFFSIGSAYKYTPFDGQNFFAEWNEFLKNNTNCLLVLVGCTQADFDCYCPNTAKATNFLLKGRVSNPTKYYQVADYIVDIYPLQTGLGTLNGLYYGLPPILPYKETAMVLGKEMNQLYPLEISTYLKYTNRTAYFDFIKEEIQTGAYKKWATPRIKAHIENQFLLAPWQEQLERIYADEVKSIGKLDQTKDCLNTSKPSRNWYDFTASPTRSFNLMMLAFKNNIPFTFKLLSIYMTLIIRHKKPTGAGLKTFFNYLLGKYKRTEG